eukprot:CFRG5639T1
MIDEDEAFGEFNIDAKVNDALPKTGHHTPTIHLVDDTWMHKSDREKLRCDWLAERTRLSLDHSSTDSDLSEQFVELKVNESERKTLTAGEQLVKELEGSMSENTQLMPVHLCGCPHNDMHSCISQTLVWRRSSAPMPSVSKSLRNEPRRSSLELHPSARVKGEYFPNPSSLKRKSVDNFTSEFSRLRRSAHSREEPCQSMYPLSSSSFSLHSTSPMLTESIEGSCTEIRPHTMSPRSERFSFMSSASCSSPTIYESGLGSGRHTPRLSTHSSPGSPTETPLSSVPRSLREEAFINRDSSTSVFHFGYKNRDICHSPLRRSSQPTEDLHYIPQTARHDVWRRMSVKTRSDNEVSSTCSSNSNSPKLGCNVTRAGRALKECSTFQNLPNDS